MTEDFKAEIDRLTLDLNKNENKFIEFLLNFKILYSKKEEELNCMTEAYSAVMLEVLRWKEKAERSCKDTDEQRDNTISKNIRELKLTKNEAVTLLTEDDIALKSKNLENIHEFGGVGEIFSFNENRLSKDDKDFVSKGIVLNDGLGATLLEDIIIDNNDVTMTKSFSNQFQDLDTHSKILCNSEYLDADVPSLNNRTESDEEWPFMTLTFTENVNQFSEICEMCKNYENQLQDLQKKYKAKVTEYKKLSEENQANIRLILTTRDSHDKLLSQLNNTVTLQEKSIIDLTDKCNVLYDFCDQLRGAYDRFRDSSDGEFKNMIKERRNIKMKLGAIEDAYEDLLGIRELKANEMKIVKCDFPTDLKAAQITLSTLRSKMFQINCTNEHLISRMENLEVITKEKESIDLSRQEAISTEYNKERKAFESKIESLNSEINDLKVTVKMSEDLEETLQLLKIELKAINKNYSHLEIINESLKKKVNTLLHELQNSESVQQDFVKLSQTLQIQLEEIRQEGKELRWQFKDDVKMCNDCQNNLKGYRKKYRCKHCGKVFCKKCLIEILTGIHGIKATVCKVCHTMLIKDAPPYFNVNIRN